MEATVAISGIETFLMILFLVFLIIFIYFGFTFNHHWSFYQFNSQFKKVAQGLYFLVSILILLSMLFFIGIYILGYGI
jgi:cellobiose-specific phosphotransferase system component IIC